MRLVTADTKQEDVGATAVGLAEAGAADGGDADVATKIVAHSFSGRPVPFGLGAPLALRGGEVLGPDGIASEPSLEWMPHLVDVLADACRAQMEAEAPWFSVPPLVLNGEAGAGRTHVARQLARHAAVPFLSFDAAGPFAADRLRRERIEPDVTLPPLPVLAMAATGCANPVILVTGLDQASDDTVALLQPMLDRRSSERWVDESFGVTFDLSHVNWLLSSVDADQLAPAIGAMATTVEVSGPPAPRTAAREAMAVALLQEAAWDLGITFDEVGGDLFFLVQAVEKTAASRIPYRKATMDVLYQAARQVLLAAMTGA